MNAETGGIKMEEITNNILEQLQNLLAIDSPTGYTKNVTDYLMAEYEKLGYTPKRTVKGGGPYRSGWKGSGQCCLSGGPCGHTGRYGIPDQIQRPPGGFTSWRHERQ